LQNYQAALRVRSALADEDPNNAEAQRDLSISHLKIGTLLDKSGDTKAALAQYRESLRLDTGLAGRDPGNGQAQMDSAEDDEYIAKMLVKLGDLPGALASEDRARQLRELIAARDDKNAEVRDYLAGNYQQLGTIDSQLAKETGNAEYERDACQWYRRGLDVMLDLQKRGALGPDDIEDMKTITAETSKCEAALKSAKPRSQQTNIASSDRK
jgi:tetratricopeptide (TPR) repeat protein